MDAKKHPSFKKETQHLKEIREWVVKEKYSLEDYEEVLKEEITSIRKTVSHLHDERLLAKQLLSQYTERDIKNLKRAEEAPYFGRIDFQEYNRDEIEEIYIGKHGLHDKDKDLPIVVDWRAPVADIYYSGHSKDVEYRAPMGEIKGTLHLKRRYEIEKGELNAIYDEKTSEGIIEDSLKGKGDFLIEALDKNTSGRLKEIVATIQDQQNSIIRSDMLRPLVVQGVAGSGKTTIALHRMAYLIYNNRKNIENANYMVMAPNKLFLDYIADILPDLGVENVIQTTFEDWALDLIDRKINIQDKTDKLNQIFFNSNNSAIIPIIAKIKGALLFKRVIDTHMKKLELNLIPPKDIVWEGLVLLKYQQIQEVFMTSNLHLSYSQRLAKIAEYLKIKLKRDINELEEKIGELYSAKMKDIKNRILDEVQLKKNIISLYDERDLKLKRIIKEIPSIVEEYMKGSVKLDHVEFYINIFNEEKEMKRAFEDKVEDFHTIYEHMHRGLKEKRFEIDDLTALAYIKIKLLGLENSNRYTHIVVDEAQDFDEFRMSLLREFVINDSFTFVGDLSQGIYDFRGINNWSRSMERVFEGKAYHFHLLTTSYRSTIEIVNLANGVIKECKELNPVMAQPVFRHGLKPSLLKCKNQGEMIKEIVKGIEELRQNNMKSLAVICKDLTETLKVYGLLKDTIEDINLLTDDNMTFTNGTVVIPSYLSKGLEFDCAFLWNVNNEVYTMNTMDIKLLYVGITRALHRVNIYYEGNVSPILNGVHELVISN
ncbi:RNA polymerase recycling motor HelD [Alkaliphilus peptidifermentans]|uniref:DNA helicase-2 / ATP-dependent DNA helicase PcrA n=1 Tax=Alkaliphilus peptidifermentans DSM 18978 TaxID=1120976 RepID=A0A1G5EN03_9FIRM|nr:RNA polymerase recycling motor HelD [Alkaliphilus peptidifermentans]SCY28171.1 DNA helicase-2 / ATP-dependent DNA helicase PcrA [Alkaliphilus peptidifermentans DSM 18978]